MATRSFTTRVRRPERLILSALTTALAPDDVTEAIDVTIYNKIEAQAVTSGFTSGNIALTAQSSQDGTNWVTLGTALTISANGTAYSLGSATAPQDITTKRYVRWIRGGDSNGGTVQIQATAGNSPVNMN